MTLDEIFNHGVEVSKMLFEAQGELQPMWVGEDNSGSILPIMGQMPERNERDGFAYALKRLLESRGIIRYVAMLERWMVIGKVKEMPKSVELGASIQSHPDRQEAIWVTAEDKKSNETRSGYYVILRPEHGKAKLAPFKHMDSSQSEGRFAKLLTT